MEEFKDYKIKLWTFDTKVYNEEDFRADDGKDLLDYEIFGGGGTDFDVNWTYMKDQIFAQQIICLQMAIRIVVMKITVIQFLLSLVTMIKIYKIWCNSPHDAAA